MIIKFVCFFFFWEGRGYSDGELVGNFILSWNEYCKVEIILYRVL